jgi:hypothetical protein
MPHDVVSLVLINSAKKGRNSAVMIANTALIRRPYTQVHKILSPVLSEVMQRVCSGSKLNAARPDVNANQITCSATGISAKNPRNSK